MATIFYQDYLFNTKSNGIKTVAFLLSLEGLLSQTHYDFLDDLIFYSSVNNAHSGSQNWLIYHFIQYLYSETLRQLIECDNLWQPFLYSFHHSEKEQKVHIKIQYNCYF
uniref:hypothetical protein n=1 Tax=Streptococcus pluranimalium TaxID=82348 RepID=UPI003F692D6E